MKLLCYEYASHKKKVYARLNYLTLFIWNDVYEKVETQGKETKILWNGFMIVGFGVWHARLSLQTLE